jgi:hypothetical protein
VSFGITGVAKAKILAKEILPGNMHIHFLIEEVAQFVSVAGIQLIMAIVNITIGSNQDFIAVAKNRGGPLLTKSFSIEIVIGNSVSLLPGYSMSRFLRI